MGATALPEWVERDPVRLSSTPGRSRTARSRPPPRPARAPGEDAGRPARPPLARSSRSSCARVVGRSAACAACSRRARSPTCPHEVRYEVVSIAGEALENVAAARRRRRGRADAGGPRGSGRAGGQRQRQRFRRRPPRGQPEGPLRAHRNDRAGRQVGGELTVTSARRTGRRSGCWTRSCRTATREGSHEQRTDRAGRRGGHPAASGRSRSPWWTTTP